MIAETMGIYIRNPKLGIYYGQYRQDGKLIRVSLHTKNRREALLLWKKIQKQRREAKLNLLDNSRITISQIRKVFLDERTAFLAETSLERYKYALLAIEDGLGPKTLIRSLTTRKIAEWASTRLKTGIKATTVNTVTFGTVKQYCDRRRNGDIWTGPRKSSLSKKPKN